MGHDSDLGQALELMGVLGQASAGFEGVREAFGANFTRRREPGAACCAYVHGEQVVDALRRDSNIARSLRGSELPHDAARVYARDLEVPSGGGVGTARALARAYSVFATGGHQLQLRSETLALLAAPAVPPARGFYDECIKGVGAQFSPGFMKPSPALPFGSASAFGSPGAGGAMGFADPAAGVGYAYVTNRMGTRLNGDPRDVALRDALHAALSAPPRGPSTMPELTP